MAVIPTPTAEAGHRVPRRGVQRGTHEGDGVPACARRASCARSGLCHRVPPRVRMGSRRLPRRRHVLRPLGLPDHEPAPRGVHPRGPDRPRAASGRGGRGGSSRRSSWCSRRSRRTRRGGPRGVERRRSGATAWPPSSTRPTGGSSSRTTRTSSLFAAPSLARAHLVAGDRGAVLPVVARSWWLRAWRSAGAGERHSSVSRRSAWSRQQC